MVMLYKTCVCYLSLPFQHFLTRFALTEETNLIETSAFYFSSVVLVQYLHKRVVSHTEAIWLATLIPIHFLFVPAMLAPVPRSLCDKSACHNIENWNYQHDCFGFCLLSNGCLCVCHSFTNIKERLQNAKIALNPLWTPSTRQEFKPLPCFLAELLFQAWCFSSSYFLQLWVTIRRVTYRPGLSCSPYSCLLLYGCFSCLPCCSIWGPVGTAATYRQSCKKLSLPWTYIHYLRPWKAKMKIISAQPRMVLNTSCESLSIVVSTVTEARTPL